MTKISKVSKSDRRKTIKRLAFDVKVLIYRISRSKGKKIQAFLLDTKDLTQKGLFLKTPNIFPIGTELYLELELPTSSIPICAVGHVAWIAKKSHIGYYPGMGVALTKIKRGEGKRLREFLKHKFRNYHQAVELKKMYLQLKEMGAKLYDLEQDHPNAEHFRNAIEHAIKDLDRIAHILDREVWEVKQL
ncbi:PilZ domain-containing protein [Candidatus Omnitrophota bacterium]